MVYGKDDGMPVKYIGAALVFVSCSAVGFMMAANYRKEERYLFELIRTLENMECELEYRLTPLPHMCRNAAVDAYGSIGKVLNTLADELDSQVSPDAACCMQIALSSMSDLPHRIQSKMLELGNSLGRYDLDGQLKEIDAVKRSCSADLEEMRSNRDKRVRSYQTLGLCAGAGLAILLL